MSLTRLVINTPDSATSVANHLNPQATSKMQSKLNLGNWFQGMSMGTYPDATEVILATGAVKASGTVTFSSTGPVNDETMVVAGATITAKTSATPGELQFTRSNTPNVNAVNLAALLNSHASFTGIVTAEVTATGVVTISAYVPGTIGNVITLTESMTNTAVSGSGVLASGSNGTTVVL